MQHDNDAENKSSYNASQKELESTKVSVFQTNTTLTVARITLSQTQSELQESQERLDGPQTCNKEQIQKLQEELQKAWADRDAAMCELNS